LPNEGRTQTLNEIKRRWEAWRSRPFPQSACDSNLCDVDLASIDTFSAGCINTFVSNDGKLDRNRIRLLQGNAPELDRVLNALTNDTEEYFRELSKLSNLVLEFVR